MMDTWLKSIGWIFIVLCPSVILAQCEGPPSYIFPANNTGQVAFPEANWDRTNGVWANNQFYPGNVKCTWVIKAPLSHVILIKFIYFNTEEKFDFVSLYPSEARENQLFHFAGNLQEPWEAVTPGNTLLMDFFSDEHTTFHGFLLAYRFMPQACQAGGSVVSEDQLIAFPPWNLQGALPGPHDPTLGSRKSHESVQWFEGSTYPQGMNCSWFVEVKGKELVRVNVLKFNTDADDILWVWQIKNGAHNPLYKYSANLIPSHQIQSSHPLLLNFESLLIDQGTGSGFLLNISYVSKACPGEPQELVSPKGSIAYPRSSLKEGGKWVPDSSGSILGPDDCQWLLKAPEGYAFNITIEHFDTRVVDRLEMLEGGERIFNHGGRQPTSREVITKGNEVVLKFNAKDESRKTGFLLHYSWIIKDCKFSLKDENGVILSPFYPSPYGGGLICQWRLQPKDTTIRVHVVLTRLHLDEGDFLQITDGDSNVFLSKSSYSSHVLEFNPSPFLDINFHSDATNNNGYFLIRYDTFLPGSCNFTLTMCGWTTTVDPLGVWKHQANEGMLIANEESPMPRGYRSKLASPLIQPEGDEGMCLEMDYVMKGEDAFKLQVSTVEYDGKGKTLSSTRKLMEMHGPQGEYLLTAAVNMTAEHPFQVQIGYERGYGPHYNIWIATVRILPGSCKNSATVNKVSAFNCNFDGSFCGWKNTHTDHRNWQLDHEGATAMVFESTSLAWTKRSKIRSQHADLLSPTISLDDLRSKVMSEDESLCLTFDYKIHSSEAELKVVVIPVDETGIDGYVFQKSINEESQIWTQGRVESSSTLKANIPLVLSKLPSKWKIILRGISLSPNGNKAPKSSVGGITVQKIKLGVGKCAHAEHCDFNDGFCVWKLFYTGGTVWSIRKSLDEEGKNNSHAAITSSGSLSDLTDMISPTLNGKSKRCVSFRYLLMNTRQCIQVAIATKQKGEKSGDNTNVQEVNILWEQCTTKGTHWLQECIDLPKMNQEYQVIIRSGSGGPNSQVWLDDLRISENSCSKSRSKIKPSSALLTWACDPNEGFCGMTQPLMGAWDWVYVHNALQKDSPSISQMPSDSLPQNGRQGSSFMCPDGRELDPSWVCDGVSDCSDESDEIGCDCGLEGCGNVDESSLRTCPTGFFPCHSGRSCLLPKECEGPTNAQDTCLPMSSLCDGHPHCSAGEDEISCDEGQEGIHPLGPQWQNDLPRRVRRNHHRGDVEWAKSQQKRTLSSDISDRLQCSGGLYIPKSFMCDGRKDCPLDGLDEVGCLHCSSTQYICPSSGVCIPIESVCDNEVIEPTCTDEYMCLACAPGHFACDVCIESERICDGVWDCMDGLDEIRCHQQLSSDAAAPNHKSTVSCTEGQFQCSGGGCISVQTVCDRSQDCVMGDDEKDCPVYDNEESHYLSAVPSNVVDEPWSGSPAYLITPALRMLKGAVGVITFKYKMDAWMGPLNVTLSVEILDAVNPSMSLTPWALWRQSGHKGNHWFDATVVVPNTNNIDSFKLGFLLTGTAFMHRSQMVKLAKISYKTVQYKQMDELDISRDRCEFKRNWCGWIQPYNERGYTWKHTFSSTHSRRTGPISGFHEGDDESGYLVADSLWGIEGDTANLISPPLNLGKDGAICFRFMVFLYGVHIGKITVQIFQVISGYPHTLDIHSLSGSQGLSWVPVAISITADNLKDPNEPFSIGLKATKGSGPEADIAVDHFSFAGHRCDYDKTTLEHSLESSSILDIFFGVSQDTVASSTYIFSLTAGPSLTRFKMDTSFLKPDKDGKGKSSGQMGPSNMKLNETLRNELCSFMKSCTHCVSSRLSNCVWCDASHSCVDGLSTDARNCPTQNLVWHNMSGEARAGEVFCPRILSGTSPRLFVAVETSPDITFAVTNIKPSHSKSKSEWSCIFNFDGSFDGPKGVKKMEERSNKWREKKEIESNSLGNLTSNEINERNEDEKLWNKLKKMARKKIYQDLEVKVRGEFQGSVVGIDNGDSSYGVGVGTIKCGDGESLLEMPEDMDTAMATVKLITPDGTPLDNPQNVHLLIYSCGLLAEDCDTCTVLNSSFACGWCSSQDLCTSHAQCASGLWQAHTSTPSRVCRVQEDLEFIKELLSEQDTQSEMGSWEDILAQGAMSSVLEEKQSNSIKGRGGKRKTKKNNHDRNGNEEGEIKGKRSSKPKKGKNGKNSKEEGTKTNIKISKKNRRRGFIKVPIKPDVYVARDAWRLHTGRQYYIPVVKKTLVNLGFVRQITYGSLSGEKSRTILVDGKWKKAAGFYIDMYEKAGQDPVTSVVTSDKDTFNHLLSQMQGE